MLEGKNFVEIQIALGSSTPLYRQIVDQVCRRVAEGKIQPGEALPSVRSLAERLVINPNTVAHAYAELQQAGIVESQRGRGLYVTERRAVFSEEERRRRLDQALDLFLHEAHLLNLTPEEILQALQERVPGLEAYPHLTTKTGGRR
jgi:GntR family transcriptional regulator